MILLPPGKWSAVAYASKENLDYTTFMKTNCIYNTNSCYMLHHI